MLIVKWFGEYLSQIDFNIESIWLKWSPIIRNPGSNFSSASDSTFYVKMTPLFFQCNTTMHGSATSYEGAQINSKCCRVLHLIFRDMFPLIMKELMVQRCSCTSGHSTYSTLARHTDIQYYIYTHIYTHTCINTCVICWFLGCRNKHLVFLRKNVEVSFQPIVSS